MSPGRAAFAAYLAFAAGALTKPALAEDSPGLLNSLMNYMGTSSPKKDPDAIDYQARPPLVVPPSNNLPKPKESSRDPAWPQNSDLAKERRAALDPRRPLPSSNKPNGKGEGADSQQSALPAEGPMDTCEGTGIGICLSAPWHAVTSLVTGMGANPVVQPGSEPTRRYLIEPPPGYRKASAVPKTANDKQSPTDKNEDTGGKNGGFFDSFFHGSSVDDRTGMDMKSPTSN
ncbi:MAG: hypothetical protein FWC84_07190 [Alphaproteobacteria bacterium]|nr:hypothetical protein [Alphaproteobacteria bacterium]